MEYHDTGSHGDDYVVSIDRAADGSVDVKCTCQAGRFGQICKHVMGVLESEPDAASMLAGTEYFAILKQYNDAQAEIKKLQAQAKKTKKLLAQSIGLTSK